MRRSKKELYSSSLTWNPSVPTEKVNRQRSTCWSVSYNGARLLPRCFLCLFFLVTHLGLISHLFLIIIHMRETRLGKGQQRAKGHSAHKYQGRGLPHHKAEMRVGWRWVRNKKCWLIWLCRCPFIYYIRTWRYGL